MTGALERGIYDAFTADATLNGLLSGRVYPLELPDDMRTFPAIVYQVIDNARQHNQDGDQGATFARVQFRLYDTTYAGCATLRDAFVDFCKAHHNAPNTGFGSPVVYLGGWFIETEQDESNPNLKGSGTRLFSKRLDATIHTNDL